LTGYCLLVADVRCQVDLTLLSSTSLSVFVTADRVDSASF